MKLSDLYQICLQNSSSKNSNYFTMEITHFDKYKSIYSIPDDMFQFVWRFTTNILALDFSFVLESFFKVLLNRHRSKCDNLFLQKRLSKYYRHSYKEDIVLLKRVIKTQKKPMSKHGQPSYRKILLMLQKIWDFYHTNCFFAEMQW